MITFICSSSINDSYPDSNNEVVFVGRSNVGKSSLINALYGKVAYVGKTPGKTRLLNFFNVDNKYTVCDVPGYGYAKISDKDTLDFGKLMESYFSNRDQLKLCVLIFDIRRIPNEDDLDMIDFLNVSNMPYIVVFNKSDKLSNNEIFNQMNKIKKVLDLESIKHFIVSTLKKTNIKDLKEFIEEYILDD